MSGAEQQLEAEVEVRSWVQRANCVGIDAELFAGMHLERQIGVGVDLLGDRHRQVLVDAPVDVHLGELGLLRAGPELDLAPFHLDLGLRVLSLTGDRRVLPRSHRERATVDREIHIARRLEMHFNTRAIVVPARNVAKVIHRKGAVELAVDAF